MFTYSLFCIWKFGNFFLLFAYESLENFGKMLAIFKSVNQFSKSYVFVDISVIFHER